MRFVDQILVELEDSINTKNYRQIETDKIELKDLSTDGDWKELFKSVCAFLNTRGGTIVIGINENTKTKEFKFTGFNLNNEPKLKELVNSFVDDEGNTKNLSNYIRPDLFEVIDFMGGKVCVLFIEKLPDELKYIFYKNEAYERLITGDHKIPKDKIEAQKELKLDIQRAQELKFVANSTLSDLDVDKLNEYITRLNKDVKVETLKSDIQSAISFLNRKKFVRENNPTILGMLVCGNNIYDFLSGRCQVDCYLNSKISVADDKKVFKDNIIQLMEKSISFVFSKIATGINLEKGGSTTFEYPERVIRETVNNALAHRDYDSTQFTTISITPNQCIEIKNPGKFRSEQLIYLDSDIQTRRIIPIPKAKNPNLADVLKSFDRWEGKGWGMSTLTNFALENSIDVPYYKLYTENDIGLTIPKGKVLDDNMELLFEAFSKYILTKTNGKELSNDEKTVLSYLYKSETLNRADKYTVILTPDNNHFEAIDKLNSYNLIYKHLDSPTLYPLYVVDRTLFQLEFIDALRNFFGGDYDILSNEMKSILDAIYMFNEYSLNTTISANLIGRYLYAKDRVPEGDYKEFDNFKRKIRNFVNKLEKKSFIVRKEGGKPNYKINANYRRVPSFFDNN